MALREVAPLALLLLLGGCFGADFTEVDPLDEADSPCYRANLADGLSETDPNELMAVYECLNVRGALDGAGGLVRALTYSSTREDREASLDLARTLNRLPEHLDVLGSLTAVVDLLREQNEFLVYSVRLAAEWIYGLPWPEVEAVFASGGGDLLAPEAVQGGLVQPLIPLIGTLAGAVLDQGGLDATALALEDLLTMEELAEVMGTMATMVQEQESELLEHTPADLAAFLEASQEPLGDNLLLRLVVESLSPSAALGGQAPITAALDPLQGILADQAVTERLVSTLGQLYTEDALQPLPAQVYSLLTIDVNGEGWSPGQETAFAALFQLLDDADQPVQCALGLFEVDSLAVFILETIALFDASTVEATVILADGLVQDLVGLLDLLCTGVDPGLQERYPAIIRLAETGAMHATTPLLQALYDPFDPGHDRLRELLDLLFALQRGGVMDEVAALGQRTLDEPFMGNVMTVVAAFVAPEDPEAVGDLFTMMRVLEAVVSAPAGEGPEQSPLGLLVEPLRETIATHEEVLATWLADFAVLLSTDGSQTQRLLEEAAPLLQVDPDLDTLAAVGRVLGDVELSAPLWRVLDTPEVAAALASSTNGEGEPGMLGLVGRISADGTLEEVLGVITWLLETIDRLGLLPES
jgi:hypothetical protein